MLFSGWMARIAFTVGAIGLSAWGASLRSGQHPPTPPSEGREIFSASCANCHTVTGHDTRAPGGDLGLSHLTAVQIASFARIMPVHPRLTAKSIVAVAAYVAYLDRAARG